LVFGVFLVSFGTILAILLRNYCKLLLLILKNIPEDTTNATNTRNIRHTKKYYKNTAEILRRIARIVPNDTKNTPNTKIQKIPQTLGTTTKYGIILKILMRIIPEDTKQYRIPQIRKSPIILHCKKYCRNTANTKNHTKNRPR